MLLVFAAHAGTATLVLPPGEEASAWVAPAALAGLDIGVAGNGPTAKLWPGADTWTLEVRVGAAVKTMPMKAPTTPALREDAAWLAASMVRTLSEGPSAPSDAEADAPVATVTTVPTASARPRPRPRVVEEPAQAPPAPEEPVPPAAGPAPPEVAPPLQAVVILPSPPPRVPVRPWVSAGPALSWRDGTSLAAALDVDGGLSRGAGWLSLGISVATPRLLAEAGGTARLSAWEVRVGGSWCPDRPVAPLVGAAFAVNARTYEDADAVAARYYTPGVLLEGGAAFALPHDLQLVPALQVRDDLVTTLVGRGGGAGALLSPWQVDLVVALRFRP